jgi:hypothetical protein
MALPQKVCLAKMLNHKYGKVSLEIVHIYDMCGRESYGAGVVRHGCDSAPKNHHLKLKIRGVTKV